MKERNFRYLREPPTRPSAIIPVRNAKLLLIHQLRGAPMKALLCATVLLLAGSILAPLSGGEKQEKDIFNIAAQKAAGKYVKKIVFVGDKRPHGKPGNHEFVAGPIYLARTLNAFYPNCYAVVTTYDKSP